VTSAPTFAPDNIPPELRTWDQWVTSDRGKVPHKPRTGNRASPTNPADWDAYTEAVAGAIRLNHRLGFCLTDDDPFVVIDLDKCRDPETGIIDPWALAIMVLFPTAYIEVSASGTGIHIIGTSTRSLPAHGRRADRLELYWSRRYIVMTGDVLPGHERLGDVTEAAATLFAEYFPPAPARQPQPPTGACPAMSDAEVLERVRRATNGAKFDRLWGGDLSDYGGDASRADAGFLGIAAYWTQDEAQLDRLLRQSGLYRDKWARASYREATIALALSNLTATYSPPARPVIRPNHQDGGLPPDPRGPTVDIPTDLAALRVLVIDLQGKVIELERQVDDERRARLAAEERADRSARLQSVTMAALRSRNLGNERHLAVATAFDLAAKLGGIDTEPEPDAAFAVPLARLGDQIGASEHTVSAGLKKLDRLNLFDRQVRWVPERVDPETGELTGGHKATFLAPKVSPLEMLRVIASAPPDPITGKKNGHGGHRVACPDHPNAGTVKRWKLHCRDCDRLLEQGEEHIRPDTPTTEARPNHQDGTLVDGAEVAVAAWDQTEESSNGVVDHSSLALFGQSSPSITLAGAPVPNRRTSVPKLGGRSPDWETDMGAWGRQP